MTREFRRKETGEAATDLAPGTSRLIIFPPALLRDIRLLIESARRRAAAAVNSEMVTLYWSVGQRICKDTLASERAAYGEQIVDALSRQLSAEYGRGFSRPNLFHMIRFAETFPDRKIVYALSRQLSWTHFRQIIYLDDPLRREFYTQMCRIERWSTRVLQDKIQGMLYERTAISRKPRSQARKELAAVSDQDRVSPDLIFRDPLGLPRIEGRLQRERPRSGNPPRPGALPAGWARTSASSPARNESPSTKKTITWTCSFSIGACGGSSLST